MRGCEMYQEFGRKTLLEVWKARFCHGDFESCERYKRTLCGQRVASTLLPNGMDLKGGKS
jgi:hypothetical protein